MLTKEEIEGLKPAEIHFYTSLNLNYKRNTTRQLNELVLSIYEEQIGMKSHLNINCPKCVLDLYKKMGKIYYESIAEQNKTKAIDEPSEAETKEPNEGGSQGGTDATDKVKEKKPKRKVKKTTKKK